MIILHEHLREFLLSTSGRFFTVSFRKRTNGEIRVMTCRVGVKKFLRGGDLPYDSKQKDLLPVYDMAKRGYRTIPLENVEWVKYRGQKWTVRQL